MFAEIRVLTEAKTKLEGQLEKCRSEIIQLQTDKDQAAKDLLAMKSGISFYFTLYFVLSYYLFYIFLFLFFFFFHLFSSSAADLDFFARPLFRLFVFPTTRKGEKGRRGGGNNTVYEVLQEKKY